MGSFHIFQSIHTVKCVRHLDYVITAHTIDVQNVLWSKVYDFSKFHKLTKILSQNFLTIYRLRNNLIRNNHENLRPRKPRAIHVVRSLLSFLVFLLLEHKEEGFGHCSMLSCIVCSEYG